MSNFIEVNLEFLGSSLTEIFVFDGDRRTRLPISQIKNQSAKDFGDLEPGTLITIEIPEWLAVKEELI